MPPSTRERILDAALELIAERGLVAVTNRNLAAAAQVSLGSLTYHFASQEELLRETLLRFVGGEAERLRGIAAELRAGAEPQTVLERLQSVLATEPGRRIAKQELYLYAARHPDLHEASVACFAAYDDVVAAALDALGIRRDDPRLASVAVAVIDGLQTRRFATGDRGDAMPAADALLLLLQAVRALDA